MLLAYNDEGTGPVVVLLHGFPLSRAMWAEQVRALSPSFRAITPDLRGHGESPAPDAVYTMDQMAEDVVEMLDGLGVTEPVAMGGLSMGGYVALALVLKHPERVRALILADTRAAADTLDAARLREESARGVLQAGHPGAIVEAMLPRLFAESTIRDRPALVSPIRAMMEATSASGVAGALRGMAARPDRREDLRTITVPTLVVVGEKDAISPPDEARAIVEALPDARLAEIPEAGHLSPVENPEAFNAAILDFLRNPT
ncbi:alpha/beta fold hydrolase [Planctomyces sp. SH-PL62]|uniref:alpha/beta fold hydrolase n=1 Tax=Planctomyces sp. SH-PL62 TaxID=1636152 RepID=UPI00078CD504|nr:alpha/beta fold hydrolase [Planctomyces sp. SH-PL62]AMV36873.1 3-oxoadipate enol-lactonase 2 [Planctomyces sp. SH-PL62]